MKKLALVAIVLVCFYFAVLGMEWERLWTIFTTAQGSYVLAAVPVLLVSYLVRALRWHYLLPHEVRRQSRQAHSTRACPAMLIASFCALWRKKPKNGLPPSPPLPARFSKPWPSLPDRLYPISGVKQHQHIMMPIRYWPKRHTPQLRSLPARHILALAGSSHCLKDNR